MADSTTTPINWELLAERLQALSAALADTVNTLTRPQWLAPYASAVYRSLASTLLARYQDLLQPGAMWEDVATGEVLSVEGLLANYPPQAHLRAFPDHKETIVRLRATDDVMIVSRRVRGTHRGPMMDGSAQHRATGRPIFEWVTDVMQMTNGKITRVRHYHDPTGLLINLGELPDFPGHGTDAIQPALLQLETRTSFGRGNEAVSRRNAESLLATFSPPERRTAARLAPLMAPDAVLVDVPLGIVYRGVEEMMQHPHSNWAASFPDSRTEVLASYAGADWTAVEYRTTGTFTNDLTVGDMTLAATGETVQVEGLETATYDHDGHVAEATEECPTTEMMVATGAL